MSTLLYNVIAAVLALAILYGLNLMSNVKTAVRGNILSAAAMACAILITMYKDNSLGSPTLWVAIALGTAFGLFLSNKVKMIQMPQLVAFLHGFGGGAAALVGLIMLTDVAGVLDPEGKLIQSIRVEDAAGLYENGTVTGGMIPKLNCCIDAIEQGVEKVMIVDGRVENCVLLELLTDQGVGTEIVGEER